MSTDDATRSAVMPQMLSLIAEEVAGISVSPGRLSAAAQLLEAAIPEIRRLDEVPSGTAAPITVFQWDRIPTGDENGSS